MFNLNENLRVIYSLTHFFYLPLIALIKFYEINHLIIVNSIEVNLKFNYLYRVLPLNLQSILLIISFTSINFLLSTPVSFIYLEPSPIKLLSIFFIKLESNGFAA